MDATMRVLQLQTLLEETTACVAACDETGQLTMFSPALEELFKQPFGPFEEEELATQFALYDASGSRLLRPDEVPIVRARKGELVKDAAITARVPGRPLLHLVCNGAPLREDDGTIRGAILVVKDVTDEVTALHDQVELRKRVVGSINHEFRTSLAALLGHVDLLRDFEDDVSEDVRRPLDSIHASAWRLRNLAETISDLVELELDQTLVPAPCDLGRLVRTVIAEIEDFADCRRVALAVTIDADGPADLDAVRVRRAVTALVQNAITYAPTGSKVQIAVSGDAAEIRVQVCDLGRGIPARERSRMLLVLARNDQTEAPDTGRGLSLAVAHTIAVGHGGRLELSDHEPSGLCATLVLPRIGAA